MSRFSSMFATEALTSAAEAFSSSLRESTMVLKGSSIEMVGVKLFPARKQRLSVKAGGQVQVGWQPGASEMSQWPLL